MADLLDEGALDFEQAKLEKEDLCGGTADIAKFFDQVVREVVYCLCRIMGSTQSML